MLLDLIFAVIIILAILKGYQNGLVVGLFSLVAVIVGLAAAMKLSTVVAGYIGSAVKVSDQWLPIISFAVVFFIVKNFSKNNVCLFDQLGGQKHCEYV